MRPPSTRRPSTFASDLESTCTIQVTNSQGLHARPCHAIVSTALGYQSQLRLRVGAREVNGKSILELMTLGAAQGTEIAMRAWGGDAEDLLTAVRALFESGFGEQQP